MDEELEITLLTQSVNLNQQIHTFLLCPNCKVGIPSINLSKKSTTLLTLIKCSYCHYEHSVPLEDYLTEMKQSPQSPHHCSMKTEHNSHPSSKYCINCQQWACQSCLTEHKAYQALSKHTLACKEIKATLSCAIHSKKIKQICNECNALLCQLCLEQHMSHEITECKSIDEEVKRLNIKDKLLEIQAIRDEGFKRTASLVSLIDKKIEKWTKIKEDLNRAYIYYDRQNEMILEMIYQLQMNYELLKEVPSIELFNNIKHNVNVNKEEVYLKENLDLSLDKQCLDFILHLNTSSIIRFNLTVTSLSSIKAHSDEINCMIQLTDGRLLTGSDDKTIKVWNLNELKCEQVIQGKTEEVYCLVQINSEKVASGSRDFLIQFWSISNWKCYYTIDGHTDSVFGLIELSNGFLASCSGDKTIKLWDTSEFNCVNTFLGHTEPVFVMLLLSNGLFASGSYDATVKLWKTTKVECLTTLKGHSDLVTSLTELKDLRVASGSKDKTIVIWNVETFSKERVIEVTRGIVFALIQLSNGNLVSGSFGDLTVWSLNSNKALAKFSEHLHYIKGLIELNGKRIVSCSCDMTIKIWTIE